MVWCAASSAGFPCSPMRPYASNHAIEMHQQIHAYVYGARKLIVAADLREVLVTN